MTAVTAPATKRRMFDGLRLDWSETSPLATYVPSFGRPGYLCDDPESVPKWRIARYKVILFLRGYEERWRAIKALTIAPDIRDNKDGTSWSRSKWERLRAVPLLLVAPVTWHDPDCKANVDELIAYDGFNDGYSWAATILYTPVGCRPFGRVYIYRERESTY